MSGVKETLSVVQGLELNLLIWTVEWRLLRYDRKHSKAVPVVVPMVPRRWEMMS